HQPRVRHQRRPRRRAPRHPRTADGRPRGNHQRPEGRRTRRDEERRAARRWNKGNLAMQWLAALCVKRPVFATVLILSLTVVGLFSFTRLGVDRFPKVDFPTITVTTVQPGAAPEQIETEITDKV